MSIIARLIGDRSSSPRFGLFGSGDRRSQTKRILTVLLGEVQSLSVLIAATTSVVNALSKGNRRLSIDDLASCLPAAPVIYPALAQQLCDLDIPSGAIAILQSFHTRLEFARNLTRSFCAQTRSGTAGAIDFETVADAWHNLAGLGLLLNYELERQLALADPRHVTSGSATKLLLAVRSGESPCLAADGSIAVPGWAERRSHRRRPLGLPATLWCGGRQMAATVKDISIGGAGLDDVSGLTVGAALTIDLPHGRRLQGHVVWATDRRAGVKFTHDLDYDDPLLAADAPGRVPA